MIFEGFELAKPTRRLRQSQALTFLFRQWYGIKSPPLCQEARFQAGCKRPPLGLILLTIHSLKRDLFAPYRVKNARKTLHRRVFIGGHSILTMKDAHRATLQSSFALAHDDSSPSQGEPKQCRRPKAPTECTLPNASPCLRGGGTSGFSRE